MRKFILLLNVFFIFLFCSCSYGNKDLFYYGNFVRKRCSELKILEDKPSAENIKYKVLVLTDLHFGVTHVDDPVPGFKKWYEGLTDSELPAFCLSLGDQVDHGYRDELKDYDAFVKYIESRNVKVYNVIGNHDLYNSGWGGWKDTCYPNTSTYKFETQKISWYGLDSGSALLGIDQYKALEKAFEKDKNKKIIFTHYPLYTKSLLFCMEDTTERNMLIKLFDENNVIADLGGHIHKYETNHFYEYDLLTFPSFRYDKKWGMLTIDESEEGKITNYKIISGD